MRGLKQRKIPSIATLWIMVIATTATASDPLPTHTVLIEGISFTIPDGCTLEQVAAPELCTWPIVATWDSQGNLLVAESVWNRESVQQQLVSRPHRIVRLSDRDRDGRFDHRQVVAESLSFPEGILCMGNDLLVSAPPEIWKLTDSDGDGVCESRAVWFDGTTLTHCANDLHGPWLGPDGWVYWSKSAFAEQSHLTLDGKSFKSSASHLFRRHPSGGPIEPVMTGGMDNLVDIAWLPNGERFFCATFLHHPRHAFRDGIGHAMYGAVFGKPHAVLDGHRKTGPWMDPLVELGPAAPAGLLYLSTVRNELANAIPIPAWSNGMGYLVSAQFNLHKIGLHQLAGLKSDAGYTAQSIDLLSSPRIDFHPVDVLLDRDGSLLILDTGGWYDLCCPSSGPDQRVALGGIYRLRGATGSNLGGPSTDDGSIAVANDGAVSGARVPDVARALVEDPNHQPTWDRVLSDLHSPDSDIRISAMNLVALYRQSQARSAIVPLLQSDDTKTVRMAAECLGRIGIQDDELPLLMTKFDSRTIDRSLRHAILFALMEGSSSEKLRPYLNSSAIGVASAAALALDQLHGLSESDTAIMCTLAAHADADVSRIGLEVLEKNPDWSDHAIEWLTEQYRATSDRYDARKNDATPDSKPLLSPLATILSRWSEQASVQQLVSSWLDEAPRATPEQQAVLLETLVAVRGRNLPTTWERPLAKWIEDADEHLQLRLADSLASLPISGPSHDLTQAIENKLAKASGIEPERWLRWSRSLPVGHALPNSKELPLVENCLAGEAENRKFAIATLQRIRFEDPASIEALLLGLDRLSPLELPVAIDALLRDNSSETDQRLLDRLRQIDTAKTLNVDNSLSRLRGRDPNVVAKWKDTLDSLQRTPDTIAAEVERWLNELPEGDARQGYHVFRSDRAACSACHQIGYVGGNVGPILSQIGRSRTRRDLLEAIVFPNARLEQSYRSTKIRTTDGEVFNGLIVEETSEIVTLQLAADRRVDIAVSNIEAREASQVSIMPTGLDQQLTKQELADLVAFLENAK